MLSSLQEAFKKTNIAEILSDNDLKSIAQTVESDYEQDLSTCSTKIEEIKKILELAMIIAQQKNYPWSGASNIIFPLIANACIEFGASCYPEIIRDGHVVKAKIIGKDDGKPATFDGQVKMDPQTGKPIMQGAGEKEKRGERISTMMNYQLLEQMTWWESDVDKEVHALPALGTLYKKVYYDPLSGQPVSELIFPDKIVVNNNARDIDSAIVTQIIDLYPQEIMQRIRSGFYIDFDYDIASDADNQAPTINAGNETVNSDSPETNSKLHSFLEQHTWLDLDEDGFPEPYIVTLHYDSSKCVRIVPRFKPEDVKYNEAGEVQEIKAKKYYVVRRFIPSLDGSFLGMGFGHLLFNMNNAINTTLNQMIDAGHLSITGGGFVGKGFTRGMRGGKLALSPGEWKMVDTQGSDLASNIVPLPMPQPSSVLFTLLGALIDAGKELGSLRDVLTGEIAANTAPTTMMSLVEQGMKQFKSIYKRYYKSLKDEFELLYDCNAEHLSNEEYANVLDEEEKEVSVKDDFDRRSCDIVPIADPNMITSSQKMGQAAFLMQFLNDPFVNGLELRKMIFNIANIDNIDKMLIQPQPTPDPAQILAEAEKIKADVKAQEVQIKVQEASGSLEKTKYEIEKLISEVEVNRSVALKNSAEVGQKEKELHLKAADTATEAMRKHIETQADIHAREREHELAEKQMKSDAMENPGDQAVS